MSTSLVAPTHLGSHARAPSPRIREPVSAWLSLTHLIEFPPEDGTLRPRLAQQLQRAEAQRRESPAALDGVYQSAVAAVRYLQDLLVSRTLEDPIVSAVRRTALRRLGAAEHLRVRTPQKPKERATLRQEMAAFMQIAEDLLGVEPNSGVRPSRRYAAVGL
tara:strand:+ start:317 stop:799 length:483 start_codon:yes stop_codon:yes gene_type:complete